ncbi:riboflavin biosynthesis protein RibD, partial [Francisella tularensis subsp. holarctica]|nr:riboflavin biosynthesis protein RibD [Francisella tularensis subsp. holarctica]
LTSLIKQQLVNELYTYVAPVIIADSNPKQQLSFNQISVREDIIKNSCFKENSNV